MVVRFLETISGGHTPPDPLSYGSMVRLADFYGALSGDYRFTAKRFKETMHMREEMDAARRGARGVDTRAAKAPEVVADPVVRDLGLRGLFLS